MNSGMTWRLWRGNSGRSPRAMFVVLMAMAWVWTVGLTGCQSTPAHFAGIPGTVATGMPSPTDIVGWSQRDSMQFSDINPTGGCSRCREPKPGDLHTCIGGAGEAPVVLRAIGVEPTKTRYTLLAGDLSRFGTSKIEDWQVRLHRSQPRVGVEKGGVLVIGLFQYIHEDERERHSWPWLRGRRITGGGPVASMDAIYLEMAIEVSDSVERFYLLNQLDVTFKAVFTDDQGITTDLELKYPSYVEARKEGEKWVVAGPVAMKDATAGAKEFLARMNAARVAMDTK